MGWVVVAMAAAGWGQQVQPAREATEKMAATVVREWPAGVVSTIKKPGEWSYEEGVLLDGMAAEWANTKEQWEFSYIRAAVDKYVRPDGTIVMGPSGRAFPVAEHTLDDIEMGRAVLFLYRQTKDERYAKAAKVLHEALKVQPRTPSGGYWHKQIYPNQMWLDGAYMAEPFRAEYAATFGAEKGEWADISKQFALMDEHMDGENSGLLRHGWDESKKMPWADPKSGLSPEIWARAMGWYCMALVDVLDWMPAGTDRVVLIDIVRRRIDSAAQFQDLDHKLWWQVMNKGSLVTGTIGEKGKMVYTVDRPAEKGNFLEASASAMFVYSIAKAVREGYLAKVKLQYAKDGWTAIQKEFVKAGTDGGVVLTGTVKAAGLGGTPYRSGTYEYYVGEARGDQDAKGVGAYLLAGSELSR